MSFDAHQSQCDGTPSADCSGGGEIDSLVAPREETSGGGTGNVSPAGRRGVTGMYSRDEVAALRGIFSLYDTENTGSIGVSDMEGILQKVGHNAGELAVATPRIAAFIRG